MTISAEIKINHGQKKTKLAYNQSSNFTIQKSSNGIAM